MKEIKIPFSLSEYQKGEYKVKCGKLDARIICTNADNRKYPIVALVYYDNRELTGMYSIKGELKIGCPNDDTDLFFVKQEFEDEDIITKAKDNLYLVKQEFEDGDIIIKQSVNSFFIIPFRGTNETGGVLTEVFPNHAGKIIILPNPSNGLGNTEEYRLASEDEKKIFFDALSKEGKCWNAEKKCVEEKCIDEKMTYIYHLHSPVLVRDNYSSPWVCTTYIDFRPDVCLASPYVTAYGMFKYCIPYNDKTKDLLLKIK